MKLQIFILGNYKPGDADGLAEFNFQNVSLLKDTFLFHFIQLDKQQDQNYYKEEFKDEICVHTFGAKSFLNYNLPQLLVAMLNKIDAEHSIFHLSHIYNFTNFLVARALLKLQIPYVITPHDSYVYAPNYTKQKPFIKRVYRGILNNIFDKYVLDHATTIHGITNQCSACLKYITQSPVVVVNNQVSDMDYTFDASTIKRQVCFIGRFNVYTKGIDLSLRAFKLFKAGSSKWNDIDFVLVGPADPHATSTCIELCKELALEVDKDVIFTGKIPFPQRNSILQQSKVYLHLARTEGFGLSIAQALSCFKPVIVSKQVPIADKIIAYKAGIVVNADIPEEAAKAIAEIFSLSPSEYVKIAMNARRLYEQEFHPKVIKPQLTKLYLQTFKTNVLGVCEKPYTGAVLPL